MCEDGSPWTLGDGHEHQPRRGCTHALGLRLREWGMVYEFQKLVGRGFRPDQITKPIYPGQIKLPIQTCIWFTTKVQPAGVRMVLCG